MKKRRFHWGEVLLLLLASPLLYAAEKKGSADADSRNGEAAGEAASAVHLNLTEEWDKTFPRSGKVEHNKVIFHNRYGIPLAADMYIPKGKKGKLPALAFRGLSELSKSSLPAFMRRHWPKKAF